MMNEWITRTDIYNAYKICKHRKNNTEACAIFEINEARNIESLWYDLNNHTYTIGYSNAFCVTRPKIREVFAADFRDRVVHHILMMKTMYLFEDTFVEDTYNCRVGKGTYYGHQRLLQMSEEYKDGWVLSCDIRGFFMSIPKRQLAQEIEIFLRAKYTGKDLEEIIRLTNMVVMHEPQNLCIKKGDLKLWYHLPKEKSLFTCGKGLGMAIGNLTSQIYANFHLSPADNMLKNTPNTRSGRYVDDIRTFAHDKETLLRIIPRLRNFLKQDRHLTLHPDKISIQPVRHGVNFIGCTVKQGRLYAGKRTVGNMLNMIRLYNALPEKEMRESVEKFVQRYNSYAGYMKHYKTYAIRWKVWNSVSDNVKKFVYLTGHLCVLKARTKYKTKTKLKQQYYDLRKHSNRKLQALGESAS